MLALAKAYQMRLISIASTALETEDKKYDGLEILTLRLR